MKGKKRRKHPKSPEWLKNLPVQINEKYTAQVVSLTHDGNGVCRVNGYTLFVPGALPGEKIELLVAHVKKQYGFGKLLQIVETSAERVNAPCPIYDQCGGCQLQHLSYEGQLKAKRQLVMDNLQKIGKLETVKSEDVLSGATNDAVIVHPTLGMENPWRYRNKAQVPIGEREGGLIGGFYAERSHEIIDMKECLIQHEHNDTAVAIVKEIAGRLGVSGYDETSHTGLLRHVLVKSAFATGEVMVVLVTNGERIPNVEQIIREIRERMPQVVSICQNINTARTNVILSEETRVLWGRETIVDQIGKVKFSISARSFYQVNPVQTEVLYNKALEYAELTGTETVIDAYCGIGTISLFLAQQAGQVYGVEIVEDAIADAKRNAELNGITNAVFEAGAAEVVIPAWRERGIEADAIVVDPPRKGCDASLLDTIIAMRPERVVYVSCNPSTLARDLRILEDGGFKTVEVQPVDMFPHTVHVECVVLMVRKE